MQVVFNRKRVMFKSAKPKMFRISAKKKRKTIKIIKKRKGRIERVNNNFAKR